MELLKVIGEEGECGKAREASRAVLFGKDGLVPLLFVSRYGYHKLPGGGIERGESREDALAREVLEETGCRIRVTGEVGRVVEYRSEWGLRQVSYCYLGEAVPGREPSFSEKELEQGFRLVWMHLDEAISTLRDDRPGNYEGGFIRERDLAFLKRAREILRGDN